MSPIGVGQRALLGRLPGDHQAIAQASQRQRVLGVASSTSIPTQEQTFKYGNDSAQGLLDIGALLISKQRVIIFAEIEKVAGHNQIVFAQIAAMKLDKTLPDDHFAKHLPPSPAQ